MTSKWQTALLLFVAACFCITAIAAEPDSVNIEPSTTTSEVPHSSSGQASVAVAAVAGTKPYHLMSRQLPSATPHHTHQEQHQPHQQHADATLDSYHLPASNSFQQELLLQAPEGVQFAPVTHAAGGRAGHGPHQPPNGNKALRPANIPTAVVGDQKGVQQQGQQGMMGVPSKPPAAAAVPGNPHQLGGSLNPYQLLNNNQRPSISTGLNPGPRLMPGQQQMINPGLGGPRPGAPGAPLLGALPGALPNQLPRPKAAPQLPSLPHMPQGQQEQQSFIPRPTAGALIGRPAAGFQADYQDYDDSYADYDENDFQAEEYAEDYGDMPQQQQPVRRSVPAKQKPEKKKKTKAAAAAPKQPAPAPAEGQQKAASEPTKTIPATKPGMPKAGAPAELPKPVAVPPAADKPQTTAAPDQRKDVPSSDGQKATATPGAPVKTPAPQQQQNPAPAADMQQAARAKGADAQQPAAAAPGDQGQSIPSVTQQSKDTTSAAKQVVGDKQGDQSKGSDTTEEEVDDAAADNATTDDGSSSSSSTSQSQDTEGAANDSSSNSSANQQDPQDGAGDVQQRRRRKKKNSNIPKTASIVRRRHHNNNGTGGGYPGGGGGGGYGYDSYGYDSYGYDSYGYDSYGYDGYGYDSYDSYGYGGYDDYGYGYNNDGYGGGYGAGHGHSFYDVIADIKPGAIHCGVCCPHSNITQEVHQNIPVQGVPVTATATCPKTNFTSTTYSNKCKKDHTSNLQLGGSCKLTCTNPLDYLLVTPTETGWITGCSDRDNAKTTCSYIAVNSPDVQNEPPYSGSCTITAVAQCCKQLCPEKHRKHHPPPKKQEYYYPKQEYYNNNNNNYYSGGSSKQYDNKYGKDSYQHQEKHYDNGYKGGDSHAGGKKGNSYYGYSGGDQYYGQAGGGQHSSGGGSDYYDSHNEYDDIQWHSGGGGSGHGDHNKQHDEVYYKDASNGHSGSSHSNEESDVVESVPLRKWVQPRKAYMGPDAA